MNLNALSALAAHILPSGTPAANGDATSNPLGLFADLLDSQLQLAPGKADIALPLSPEAGMPPGQALRDLHVEENPDDDTATNASTDLAALLAAIPGMPTVNPEIQPKTKLAPTLEAESAVELVDDQGPRQQRGEHILLPDASPQTVRQDGSDPAPFSAPPLAVPLTPASRSTLPASVGQAGTAAAPFSEKAANIAADLAQTAAPRLDPATLASPSPTTPQALHSPAPTASEAISVHTPLQANGWGEQFADKVVWVARTEVQSAQIHINPPQLGPVQITVNLTGDQANIAFASPHAEVRQAIESALPQLKEMLSSSGINLGDANVGANLHHRAPDSHFQSANKAPSGNENAILPASDNPSKITGHTVIQRGRGMVDLFA